VATSLNSLAELHYNQGHYAQAGWMLDPNQPLAIVLRSDYKLDGVVSLFWRTGFTNIAGYLVGGMRMWTQAGFAYGSYSTNRHI